MAMQRSFFKALASAFVLSLSLPLTCGEIRSFHGVIEARSDQIHFSEGYLLAPGYIDLSALVFSTFDEGSGRAMEDDGAQESFVDISFFHEPKECAYTNSGCDWVKLGIGAENAIDVSWCCNEDALALGLCERQQYGRLIINATAFKGQHRFVAVPATGHISAPVRYPKLEEPARSGKYILVIANCNDEGRDVLVDGKYTFKSAHGYLPGDLFGEMYFFLALTILYFILLIWYGISIKCYEDSIIAIQPWIVATIGLGFLEVFFKTGDYFVWNADGIRFWFSTYSGVILGVLKRSISLCLIVMVSMGWGVVRDSLGGTMKKIVVLGIVYAGTTVSRDIMTIFAVTENQVLSKNEEEGIVDVVVILSLIGYVLDVIFYLWILESLGSTMEYLENMNQTRKLKRYLRLRCILLISIVAAVVWGVFGTVDTFIEEAMVEDESRWAVSAAMEVNYLFVLSGVAILWRPNPDAKDYAFVMELPSMTSDNGEVLDGAAIPSAMDEDDEDDLVFETTTDGVGAGYLDDADDGLPVEDGVRT